MSRKEYEKSIHTLTNSELIYAYRALIESADTTVAEQYRMKRDVLERELTRRMKDIIPVPAELSKDYIREIRALTGPQLLDLYDITCDNIRNNLSEPNLAELVHKSGLNSEIIQRMDSPELDIDDKTPMRELIDQHTKAKARMQQMETEIFKRLEAVR